jgi:hypothetical protein
VGKKLTRRLAAGIMLALGITAIASAYETPYVSSCPLSTIGDGSDCQFPALSADFGAWVAPKKLPKREMAPVAIKLWGKVSTSDGTHPSALREATVDFDRNIVISAKGLPVCESRPHFDVLSPGGSIQKTCRSSIVGSGRADFELAFPEAPPILSSSKLTAYNAGVKAGVINLVVVAPIDVPVPRTIAIPVEIKRSHDDRYGPRAVAKVPVIAGGSGSLLDFSLRIKRLFSYRGSQKSYAMARCPDRQLNAAITARFRNEVQEPNVAATTVITGAVASPCTPTS